MLALVWRLCSRPRPYENQNNNHSQRLRQPTTTTREKKCKQATCKRPRLIISATDWPVGRGALGALGREVSLGRLKSGARESWPTIIASDMGASRPQLSLYIDAGGWRARYGSRVSNSGRLCSKGSLRTNDENRATLCKLSNSSTRNIRLFARSLACSQLTSDSGQHSAGT